MSVSPVKDGAMNQKLGLWVPRWQRLGGRMGKGRSTGPANLVLWLGYEARPVGVQMTADEGSGKGGMTKGKERLTQ